MSLNRRFMRRASALVGATALGLGVVAVAAAPAQADDTVDLSVWVPTATATADSGGKDVRVVVGNDVSATATATGVTLEFQLPKAKDAGEITLSDEFASRCTINNAGTKGSCELDDIAPGAVQNLKVFTVHPSEPGEYDRPLIGRVNVSVTADQADAFEDDNSDVLIARIAKGEGVDLAVWADRDIALRPGESGTVDETVLTVSNESGTDVTGLQFFLLLPQPVRFTDVPQGCTVSEELADVQCVWPDVSIPAGGEFPLAGEYALPFTLPGDAPFNVKLGPAMGAFNAYDQVEPTGSETLVIESASAAEQVRVETGAGEEPTTFSTAEAEPRNPYEDNWVEFAVFSYEDRADLAVGVPTISGSVGTTVTVPVTVVNHGPIATASHRVEARIPSYARITAAPKGCTVRGETETEFVCQTDTALEAGAQVVYTATVELVSAPEQSEFGMAIVAGANEDPYLLNNSAFFAVESIENRADLALSVGDVSGNPGDVLNLDFTVVNNGPAADQGFSLLALIPSHAEVGELPAGCRPGGVGVTCTSGESLEVGGSVTFTIPVTIVEAPAEQESGIASVLGNAPDPVEDNNTATFLVGATENRADLSITVSDFSGKVDDTIAGLVTVTNDGPATVTGYEVLFDVPEHAALAETPAGCEDVGDGVTLIWCGVTEPLAPGESRDIEITLTLTAAPEEQLPGNAAVFSMAHPDTDETDNLTQYTVYAETEPEVPGPGGPGEDPDPQLPVTGVSLSTAVVGAALVAALGAAALFVTKRRRRSTTYGDQ
ncbi:LPXTG-motif cell wall-anchored protein [Stackebrandtia albiflava]|uniref:LPXTG-motif cell wall-anchored protein n=1 Tax=Stackebrandtia albiflava TaxID=406432 RepID=A0A562UXT8_9ACTN|nr:LPXTG cell wall anchor domain-containing protein [Stackebrandtia albiflava]TWJ10460.1 LPXTG-motif cell wall-anchored protein [Stackebrandtia albiflava]